MKIEISKDRVKLTPEDVNEIYEIGAFMERIRTLMRKHNSKETISTEYSCDNKGNVDKLECTSIPLVFFIEYIIKSVIS